MKVEEIKLELAKQVEKTKVVSVNFENAKVIQKNIDDAKKELSKLSDLKQKFINNSKALDDTIKEFSSQKRNVEISVNFINNSAKELEQKAKDLGLGNQPIVTGARSEAQNVSKQIDTLSKGVK